VSLLVFAGDHPILSVILTVLGLDGVRSIVRAAVKR
jgi:hypothetical protein